ncbi:hypothetical protein CHARACLAT_008965 [Characodon lateralis]|uniref:Uncharacterized protein n=1 Tax=Characodon lateralis TaxID=208331 RepID=A0ABU7CW71_9TELE|nr:hypothetical protein [Characodon lateralis]
MISLTLHRHSALVKQASASAESRREHEKKAGPKPSGAEPKTSHLSQAHLLVGAVKRRSSSQSSDGSKKQKVDNTRAAGNGDRLTDQDVGGAAEGGRREGTREAEDHRAVPGLTPKTPSSAHGVLHLPSAAVCVGVLPGLCAYSGSSDSDSSSDSEV